jgi:hypothetical protein
VQPSAPRDLDTVRERLDLDKELIPTTGEIRGLRTLFRVRAARHLGIIAWS